MARGPFNISHFKRYVPDAPFRSWKPGSILPEAYRKFWREWKCQKKEAVHYIPEPGRWKRNPDTGEVTPVQNVPLPLKFPKESEQQLWGGEAVIKGFQKRKSFRRRIPHFWMPSLQTTIVYSEILNKYMSVVVSLRTMDLIHKNFGFDHYILKTPACDLQSDLALKLKRKLLTALSKKDIPHEDSEKRESVYESYKHYLSKYTQEEIEWYGLTMDEAMLKAKQEKEANVKIEPLKHLYRLNLINELLESNLRIDAEPEEKKSWLSKINPFSSKET